MIVLQDVDGVDPYAECRLAINAFEKNPGFPLTISYFKSKNKGPAKAQTILHNASKAALEKERRCNLPQEYLRECAQINDQMATPAFLRYLSGLMGAC